MGKKEICIKKQDYSFFLTNEEKKRKIENYKFWFLISLPLIFLFGIGLLIFVITLYVFIFDNLIFMWKTKHYWWFIFTLGSDGFFGLFFWFKWYLPYLQSEIKEKEVIA